MECPFDLDLANFFMCSFKKDGFKIVLMISNSCSINKMLITITFPILPSKYPNIRFSLEKEKEGYLPFSLLTFFEKNGKSSTFVYRKKTFFQKGFLPVVYQLQKVYT